MEAFDEIKNELEGMAPMLSKLPRENAFTVSDSYFDELPALVMDKINARKPRKWFDISWLLQPRWAATVAVCAVAVIFACFLWIKNFNPGAIQPVADKTNPINNVVSPGINKSSVQPLIEDEDTADELASTSPEKNTPKSKKHADKKAIEEYILDNVDESALIDAL